jgi:hypothetical protein
MLRALRYLAVGLLAVVIAICLISNTVQLRLKRLVLHGATLGGPVTWSDLCASSVVRTNEANARIVHIGKTMEEGEGKILLFTALYVYEMRYDPAGKWRIASKNMYVR